MSEKRPAPTAEEATAELNAWAEAFENVKPPPPFTPDEREQLNLLLLETKLSGDEAGFVVLRELAADPTRYRAFTADRPGDE